MGKKDSDGNRVYVGNFDADGLNVNNNWDNNRNPNIGVSASRNFLIGPFYSLSNGQTEREFVVP